MKASNVEIYPNPTSDVLNVKGMTPASVKVFAMDGKAAVSYTHLDVYKRQW